MNSRRILSSAVNDVFLRHAPAERVYETLCGQGAEQMRQEIAGSTAHALVARQELLINLALAQVVDDSGLLQRLFHSGDLSMRRVVAANPAFATSTPLLPDDGPPSERPARLRFLKEEPLPVVSAWLQSEGLSGLTLAALFQRERGTSEVADRRWEDLVLAAFGNPILHRRPGTDSSGEAHWDYDVASNNALRAAWSLLYTFEPSEQLAISLYDAIELLYWDGLPTIRGVTGERREASLLALFTHWTVGSDGSEGSWNWYGQLRARLVERILACSPHEKGDPPWAEHPDDYVRRGYYRVFTPLHCAEVDTSFERDGVHFLEEAVENPWFYYEAPQAVRERFEELTRKIPPEDPSWDLVVPRLRVLRDRHWKPGLAARTGDHGAATPDELAEEFAGEWLAAAHKARREQPSRASIERMAKKLVQLLGGWRQERRRAEALLADAIEEVTGQLRQVQALFKVVTVVNLLIIGLLLLKWL